MQVDILAHLLDELLMPRVEESAEVLFLFGAGVCIRVGVQVIRYQAEDFILYGEDTLEGVLPQVLLLTLRYSTALLVAHLDYLVENLVELLDVLI